MGQTFLRQRKAVLSPLLSVESHSSQLTPQRVLHQATKSLINLKQDCSSKGQINQKNEIFSLSLYLHQTLKRNILNEIWVKIFLPNPLQKDKYQNPSISKDFTKTLLKIAARWTGDYVTSMLVFRAEKRSAQASISTHPLLQAQCRLFCLLTAFFCVFL